MTIKESIEIERNKKSNEIVLIKDNNWWRAYEESAYLCRYFIPNLNDSDRLKPTHKQFKETNDSCIFVGFPVNSLSKYLPNIDDRILYSEDMNIAYIDIYDFTVLDNAKEKFLDWKNSIPAKSKNAASKDNRQNTNNDRYIQLMLLTQEILAYPIENKTMLDNISFISNLKRKVLNII